jgi:hypothetical protein
MILRRNERQMDKPADENQQRLGAKRGARTFANSFADFRQRSALVIRTVNSGLVIRYTLNPAAVETGRNHVSNYYAPRPLRLSSLRDNRLADPGRVERSFESATSAARAISTASPVSRSSRRNAKGKEITFGTDSLHYCPRESYDSFLFL